MKISVILYLYHTDLWNEFKKLLVPFKEDIQLYLCLCEDQDNSAILNEAVLDFDTKISFYPNVGSDVYSFLKVLQHLDTPYFLKIHSKKSLLGQYNQINWRTILLQNLLGNETIFLNNIKTIKDHKDCGSLSNKQLLLTNNENNNTNKIKQICSLINIDYNKIKNKSFFGGNMFLSRTTLFKKYFLNHTDSLLSLLQNEKGKVDETEDGTYSHSLERLFGYILSLENLNFYHPQEDSIKILNDKAPNGFFNLVRTYNNDCYVTEDLNVYGNILEQKDNESMIIRWLHLQDKPIQKYVYSTQNALIKATS